MRSGDTGRWPEALSLGIEDQAILYAIVDSGAEVDVFPLDTGRLFPETIDTLAASERHYGVRIRVLAPAAADVEALVARDGVLGFRSSIEAREACCHARKVLPLNRGAPQSSPAIAAEELKAALGTLVTTDGGLGHVAIDGKRLRGSQRETVRRNIHNAKADWHFTTADARIKLKSLYPAI